MRTVAEVLRWRARRHPAAVAVSYQGNRITFADLDRSSTELAAGFAQDLGVRPGDRVAILDKNSDRYLVVLFAIAKAGAVMVPVNWRLTAPEVALVVTDADPRLLVVDREFAAATKAVGCPVLAYEDLPRGETDPRGDSEDAVAWQLYTSGTTGLPRGARLTNGNLFWNIASLGVEMPEMVEGGASLALSPLYHVGGSGWALNALAHGSTVVMVRDVVPDQLLELMIAERIATGLIVPAVLQSLVGLEKAAGADFSGMRNIAYGASPISPTLLATVLATFGCRFTQLYGLTETTGGVTALRHQDHTADRLLSCGRAMFGGDVTVFGEDGRPARTDEIGEIVYRGPSLMEGYWRRPEETVQAVRGGWFHTGDAGSRDADGFVYIRDRIKDMIVSGGENVYPAEVEAALAAHPAIADAAVIGVPDERWGETVKAIVVLRPAMALAETELIDWARERLAGYKRPRSVEFVEALPRNASGKVLKYELRERFWTGEARRVH